MLTSDFRSRFYSSARKFLIDWKPFHSYWQLWWFFSVTHSSLSILGNRILVLTIISSTCWAVTCSTFILLCLRKSRTRVRVSWFLGILVLLRLVLPFYFVILPRLERKTRSKSTLLSVKDFRTFETVFTGLPNSHAIRLCTLNFSQVRDSWWIW